MILLHLLQWGVNLNLFSGRRWIFYENYDKQRQELISDIEKLENKLKNSPTNSSELQIYKQSVIQATKAREDFEKILVKLEKEKNLLEIKYNELNKKFESKKKCSYLTSWKFKEKKII